jgi:hypothetical protein
MKSHKNIEEERFMSLIPAALGRQMKRSSSQSSIATFMRCKNHSLGCLESKVR